MIYFERKEYLNKLISAEGNGMIKILSYMNFFFKIISLLSPYKIAI